MFEALVHSLFFFFFHLEVFGAVSVLLFLHGCVVMVGIDVDLADAFFRAAAEVVISGAGSAVKDERNVSGLTDSSERIKADLRDGLGLVDAVGRADRDGQ